MLTIYHSPLSRSVRVVWLAEELALPYRLHTLEQQRAGSWWAEVPASWVRIRPSRRKTGGRSFDRAIIARVDDETEPSGDVG
jgi:hypothetical protein